MWGIKTKDEPVKQQIDRRRSHEAIILDMFKRGDKVTTTTLRKFSANHTARISELRKEGWRIVRQYESNGVYSYMCLGNKNDEES